MRGGVAPAWGLGDVELVTTTLPQHISTLDRENPSAMFRVHGALGKVRRSCPVVGISPAGGTPAPLPPVTWTRHEDALTEVRRVMFGGAATSQPVTRMDAGCPALRS